MILQNINVLITMTSSKSTSFVTVTGEIWITRGVLQYSRTPITTLLQSQTLSLRRISVEDQSTTHLKDRSCSTRRIWCLRKQDQINMTIIRQSFQGGTHEKDIESHSRSTSLTKKKLCFSIVSLLTVMTIQLLELNDCRTSNIEFFVWILIGPTSVFDSDQNLSIR